MTSASRHRVAALTYDGQALFELSIAMEVFAIERPELGVDWYDVVLCAGSPGPLRATGGLAVIAEGDLDELAAADTVIVTGCRDVEGDPPADEVAAVRAAYDAGARVLSVCSGAFVLAAAGILDGLRATTHWMYADLLARRFPRVRVTPDVLYVDEGRVLTSAGSAAGIDLCLHVVRTDHGAAVANAVARRMVVPPHRDGGQAQYVELPVPDGSEGDGLADLLDWMRANLRAELTVASLAPRAAMSERTFARRFRAVTGTTPHQWVLRQRVARALELLETTDHPVERVAAAVGFGSAATLREHLRRTLRVTPTAYRRAFSRVGAPTADERPGRRPRRETPDHRTAAISSMPPSATHD